VIADFLVQRPSKPPLVPDTNGGFSVITADIGSRLNAAQKLDHRKERDALVRHPKHVRCDIRFDSKLIGDGGVLKGSMPFEDFEKKIKPMRKNSRAPASANRVSFRCRTCPSAAQ
jgi:hypothetical protein